MASSVIKGGYWLSKQAEQFPPAKISSSYFTHLFYASLVPDPENNYHLKITPTDERWMERFTNTVHGRQQEALLSIGEHNFSPPSQNFPSSGIFSSMAINKDNRTSFIHDSITVARKYGFDGLDLVWEYPNTQEDMNNLALLLKEWRAAIETEPAAPGKAKLLLSAATYFEPIISLSDITINYPIKALSNVDFVGPRCYDYHGIWEPSITGEHSCLQEPKLPHQNTEHGITTWLSAGIDAQKLVMGLPLYGRTWKLADPNKHKVGDPALGVGPGDNGIMPYHGIAPFIKESNAKIQYDDPTKSMYAWDVEANWIGYDDDSTIKKKVVFAKNKILRGYFLWALGYDLNDGLTEAASDAWDGKGIAH